MARGSFRRYDVQAKYAVLSSAAAAVVVIGTVLLLIRNYDADYKVIVYGNPLYQAAVLGSVALAMLLSVAGAVLGINSAGQRRNEHQRQSWLGFFLGVGVMSLAIISFAAFWMLRMKAGG